MGTCRTPGRSPLAVRVAAGAGLLAAALVSTAWGVPRTAVAPPGSDIPAVALSSGATRDTFSHLKHERVPCLGCHLAAGGRSLKFEPPQGCRDCHHGASHRNECDRCHAADRLPDSLPIRFSVAAAARAPRERAVAFPHRRHADLRCTACHGETVDRAPVDSAASCRGCHDQHHDVDRSCAICHRTSETLASHAAPARPHVACDKCHAAAVIARLTPTRSLCLACHGAEVDHNPGRECTVCHMQSAPEVWRGRLLRGHGP